jgi:hypothetical protein
MEAKDIEYAITKNDKGHTIAKNRFESLRPIMYPAFVVL